MLAADQKREIFSLMANVVADPRLNVIPVVVDKLGRGRQKARRWPLAVEWSSMLKRFERMLDRTGEESGLILADAGGGNDEDAARAVVERLGRARMARAPNRGGVMNGVIFRDSRLDVMIQMADMAAYIVHKHCRKDDRFRGWFETIRPRFDANPTRLI